jgi:hypothetical protein
MRFILIFGLFLFGCATIDDFRYTKVEARVENVLPNGTVKTNKGTYICVKCPAIIRSQKVYTFYLEGNKILRMASK